MQGFGLSVRRVSKLIEISRTSFTYKPKKADGDRIRVRLEEKHRNEEDSDVEGFM